MPFGLLLQGGDQLYADEVVRQHPGLRAWHRCRTSHTHHHAFTETMREAAARFSVERYLTLYGLPGIAALVARVPSLMLWDDHYILDGWGSPQPATLHNPVCTGLHRGQRR